MSQHHLIKKNRSAKGFFRRWFFLPFYLFSFLLFSSCDTEPQYGSPYACSFVFYTSYHTASKLTLALGNPGEYVTVVPQAKQGIMHLIITTNQGETEDLALTTEKEAKRLDYSNMGANRCLIIGCSLNAGMKAYDGQCSNCLRDLGGVSYPLKWTANGRKLACDKCGRVYDPNAEGVPTENAQKGDRNLYQYAVQYNGEVLHVYNGQPRSF